MKLEAMRRQAGRPQKNVDQVGPHFSQKRTREEIGEQPGDSGTQVQRYIRLNKLTRIKVRERLGIIEHDYPMFHLSMECFWCEVVEGKLSLLEAEDAKWLSKDTLYSVPWLPADYSMLETIKELLGDRPIRNSEQPHVFTDRAVTQILRWSRLLPG